MNAAIRDARRTVPPFLARLTRAPRPAYAAVKAPVDEGQDREHLWLAPVWVVGSQFHGVVANAPVTVTRVAIGDTLRIAQDSISDWLVVDRDTVFGAYTLAVLRARMSDRQRQAFDASQGLVFSTLARPLP